VAPDRIVSLVPSLTEALFALGVGEKVVGRTRYCLWPPRAVGKVELERLICPEFAEEEKCALCERPFVLGLVIGRALTECRVYVGEVCGECVEWLSKGPMAHSGKFLKPEDIERLEAEWRTPVYVSLQEADAAWEAAWERHKEGKGVA
jgi:hypothetical protein